MSFRSFCTSVLGLSLALCFQSSHAVIVAIPAGDVLGDATTLTFTGETPGSVAGNAAVFTSAGYSSVSLIGTHAAANGDSWESGVDGNGLAAVSGGLAIVAQNDDFSAGSTQGGGFRFDVAGAASQFGFQIIDQDGFDLQLRTYSGATLLDTFDFRESGGLPHPQRFFSETQFDAWEIVCNQGSCGGWGLDNIVLAGINTAVPEPGILALLMTGLVVGFAVRRRV